LVLIFGILAIVRTVSGWLRKKTWTARDARAGAVFTGLLDLQVLLGIILYIYPGTYTRMAFAGFGAAMANPTVRFFSVEHIAVMLIAAIVAHVGWALAKNAPAEIARFRRAAIGFAVSIVLILAAIPWPAIAGYGRPLLRLFGLALP
jgi:hypothetical protein